MPHNHDAGQNIKDLPYFQLNLCFSIFIILAQLAGWFFSGSHALLADTFHVAIHAVTEVVVILALFTASEKADKIGSWLITVLLLFLVVGVLFGAYKRYMEPKEIETSFMLAATSAGLFGNVAQRFIVRGRGLGFESADRYKLCMDTDIYSSIGVLAGVGILYFRPSWLIVDTLIAFTIAGWILWKVLKMSKKSHC